MDKTGGQKIVIYGAGQMARVAILSLREILGDFEEKVIGCAVTSLSNNPGTLEDIAVHSLDYYERYGNGILYMIAARERYKESIISELASRGLDNYEFFDCEKYITILEKLLKGQNEKRCMEFESRVDKSILSQEDYILFLSRQLKKGTINFEINFADHCNLNCQCCNHFSPLAEKVFLDSAELENDLIRLKGLLGSNTVGKVMLLGGEPLLHPKIETLLKIAGKHLPAAKLEIITNGLLLPKMGAEFWKLVKELDIGLVVTKYPVKFDYASAERIAESKGVTISYGDTFEPVKTTYHLPISDEPEFDPYCMYAKCKHANQCVVLKNGRLYTCPLAANVNYYNKYFGKHIPEGEAVSIDIYGCHGWDDVEEFLKRPNKMCSHCDICNYTYDIPWNVSRKDVREWSA